MNYYVLILLLFVSLPAFAQNAPSVQVVSEDKGVLIRSITIEGFVLGDKERFVKLFRPSRNKYLTRDDMDAVLQKIQDIYNKEGYQQLVSITYQVTKHRLVFTVLMTS